MEDEGCAECFPYDVVDELKAEFGMGLLVGITVSSAIEISQLWLCRGLFEFDDIIHNSLGCMLGCLLGNRLLMLSGRKE